LQPHLPMQEIRLPHRGTVCALNTSYPFFVYRIDHSYNNVELTLVSSAQVKRY
jgi:hypothetical protein